IAVFKLCILWPTLWPYVVQRLSAAELQRNQVIEFAGLVFTEIVAGILEPIPTVDSGFIAGRCRLVPNAFGGEIRVFQNRQRQGGVDRTRSTVWIRNWQSPTQGDLALSLRRQAHRMDWDGSQGVYSSRAVGRSMFSPLARGIHAANGHDAQNYAQHAIRK